MKKISLCFVSLVLLAACSSDPLPPPKLEADLPPRINLDVLTVTVLDRSGPQMSDSPYATNNFQPTILATLRQWATQRLVAVGTTGEAIVIIKDSGLHAQALPYREDMFERQQASKYSAHAEMTIEVHGRQGEGQVDVEASRFVTLPEKPTPAEKQAAYATLYNGLMKDFGANAGSAIRAHLSPFVVTAPVVDGSGVK